MAFHIRRVILNNRAKVKARHRVKHAVKCGQLVDLKKKKVKCADCAERATVYDHRRYSEPLAVEPVCKQHNGLRGFALDQEFIDVVTGEPSTREAYLAERAPKKPRTGDRIMSAITGSANYLRDGLEKRDWHNARTRARRQMAFEDRMAYLQAEHKYHLFCGGVDTGTEKIMTGHEAVALNKAAEAEFIRDLQTSKAVRMYRWKLAEPRPWRRNKTRIGIWQPKCTYARFGKS